MKTGWWMLVLLPLAVAAQEKKVVVTGLTPAEVQALRASAPGVRIVSASGDELAREIADADVAMGNVPASALREARKLQWLQTHSAGVENYLHLSRNSLKGTGLTLTNGKIIQGPNIADHAMALLLSLTRGLRRSLNKQAAQEWDRTGYQLVELSGKTAVVIGVGGIGMQIAVRAHAFGMRVIGVDPKDIPLTPHLNRLVPPDRLDEVLPLADVVFVAAPHTAKSDRMVGPRQFELMKPTAYFVAVSRGRIFDNDALVKALDSKRLAGAGLDVMDPEPLPKGHPLWSFDNVIISPHIAGGSDLVQARRLELYKENLRRFLAGEALLNVVDKEAGY